MSPIAGAGLALHALGLDQALVARLIGLLLIAVGSAHFPASAAAAAAAKQSPSEGCAHPSEHAPYLLASPQIGDPRCPLAFLSEAATGGGSALAIRSAVVTVADPLETQLGRTFDVQVAALIRAFQAKDFVLDAFALPWRLDLARSNQRTSQVPAEGTWIYAEQQRASPGVLVFRRDLWRDSDTAISEAKAVPPIGLPGAEYFTVFLVGESPTFGLQPRAFHMAMRCAARLDGTDQPDALKAPCDVSSSASSNPKAPIVQVIGPTFSGSMASVALGIDRLLEGAPNWRCALTSPSATVASNDRVSDWGERLSGRAGAVSYRPLARSLKVQLQTLARFVEDRHLRGPVVILAEESTFGHGVAALVQQERQAQQDPSKNASGAEFTGCRREAATQAAWKAFLDHVRVVGFPQNISAIRAEHTRQDNETSKSWRNMLQVRQALLELDLSGIDEITDRPPAYQRPLSSRSDELMLYGIFDALRVYVQPKLVVIVATDVRDRLFLLNEVRKSLPTALPVLMEMDYLTAHPDYRKISRGALVVPNGDTVLCIDGQSHLTPCGPQSDKHKSYLAFPSDYAANLFRAAFLLIENQDPQSQDKTGMERVTGEADVARAATRTTAAGASALESRHSAEPCAALDPPADQGRDTLFLTTLAGFQVPGPNGRSRMLAADGRMLLERPVALGFVLGGMLTVAVAGWLALHGREHLVLLSPLRHLNPFPGVREEAYLADPGTIEAVSPAADNAFANRLQRVLPFVLLALGMTILILAAFRLVELMSSPLREWPWHLAHGRDLLALGCVFLLYAASAVIVSWRLRLWQRRAQGHLQALAQRADMSTPSLTQGGGEVALSMLLVGVVALLLLGWLRGLPTAVDSPWWSFAIDLLLLLAGVWFLAELWSEYRRLARLAQGLAPIAELTAAESRPSAADLGWATPQRQGALPQSPFSLRFRKRDLAAVHAYPDQVWRDETRQLLAGKWPFAAESAPDDFKAWQGRLVAELRYGATAVRGCAWSAILAPAAILAGMGIYPSFNERLMTMAALVLLLTTVAVIMYVAIKQEQHPLLGPLFTRHGDELSVGSLVGALWTKLAAVALILIPVLFPDALSSLYSLLQSIDSLQ